MSLMGRYFDWPVAALLEPVGSEMTLRALYSRGQTTLPHAEFSLAEAARIRAGKGEVNPNLVSAQDAQRLADLWLNRDGYPPSPERLRFGWRLPGTPHLDCFW